MGAIKMPTSAAIAKAYEDAIPRVAARYKEKVGEVADFKEKTIAGHANYLIEMAKPEVLARQKEGVEEMPPGKWKDGARTKGAARIGPGMTEAKAERTKNYEPIRSGLDGFVIPDKTTDWETNIDNRSKAVVRKMKELAEKI